MKKGRREERRGTVVERAVEEAPPMVQRIADFTLLSEIGRGGMGVVYKARQESTGRIVALKVLPSFAGMDPESVERFRRESEAAGRLRHEGIVPVLAAGEADGVHYFAMELVEGPSLFALLQSLRGRAPGRLLGTLAEETGLADVDPGMRAAADSGPDRPEARYARSCAALFADVAQALAVAHENHVIHRDLKPSNVLIKRGGQPVIVDFGLSRDEMASQLTRSGQAVGTPAYMAPEQAAGGQDLDARADIHGLGASLYEMLALRPAFEGAHAGEVMRKILEEDPAPLQTLNPRVPRDLLAIVETCLHKDPARRYASAAELEGDLRAFLRGERVKAVRRGAYSRILTRLKRQRRNLGIAAVAVVASAMTLSMMGVVSARHDQELGEAALRAARTALLDKHDLAAASDAYSRASALLTDPERVRLARREHLRAAFASLYAEGRLALLKSLLASFAREPRDGELVAMEERLLGVGRLVLPDGLSAESVTVRAVAASTAASDFEPLPRDRRLRIGEYLVRVRRAGCADEVRHVVVARDSDARLELAGIASADAPEGMVLGLDVAGHPFWIARTELTRGQYARLLATLDDPELRRELQPKCSLEVAQDRPVHGLTQRQASLVAALLGGHLPTLEEHRRSANCGADGLRYPWGAAFDAGRVVADPDRCCEPVAADSLAEGASPLGVLHLAGNVAEILAEWPAGALFAAGGHFQSDPKELPIDAPPLALPSRDGALPVCGMRLARFVVPGEDRAGERAMAERIAARLDDAGESAFDDWTISDDGTLRLEVTLAGARSERAKDPRAAQAVVADLTEGFLASGDPVVRPLAGTSRRLAIAQDLIAVDGLRGDGDGYVLVVPVRVGKGLGAVHRVTLPRGADLASCEPEPASRFASGGRTSLVFVDAAGPASRAASLVVRFRKDGLLTKRAPALATIKQASARVFAALESRDQERLGQALSQRWLQLPSGLDVEGLLRCGAGRRSGERFGETRIEGVRAIGPIATVELTADFSIVDREGQDLVARGWPMRLCLLRDRDRWLGLELSPRSRADGGVIVHETYRHAQLKLDWAEPPGARLARELSHPCEMQVTCRGEEGVRVSLVGEQSPTSADDAEIKLRLSSGASRLRPGTRLVGRDKELIGPPDARSLGACEDWMFGALGTPGPRTGEAFARERWVFLRTGRRSFLVRCSAGGATPQEARQRFDHNQRFFQEALATIAVR